MALFDQIPLAKDKGLAELQTHILIKAKLSTPFPRSAYKAASSTYEFRTKPILCVPESELGVGQLSVDVLELYLEAVYRGVHRRQSLLTLTSLCGHNRKKGLHSEVI